MNVEDVKREIAKRIKSGSFSFKERSNDINISFFERINILNLELINESNFEYQFSGVVKVHIADKSTDGGVFFSPSRSRIEGQAIIRDDTGIEIMEPIIIENL